MTDVSSSHVYRRLKRLGDIVGGILGTLFFLILYPFVGIAIKLNTRGPVLVKLERISGGKEVNIYKFRSMIRDAKEQKAALLHLNERHDGPFFKMTNDPRITTVGKKLRKFRLDEFPQFINVLKGELSLVGPRPHEKEEVAQYPEEFKFLAQAKAGITGLSQVSGASSLSFRKELELDRYYLEHQRTSLDLQILLKTLLIIFFDPTAV